MTGRYPRRFGKYVLLKPLAKGGMGEIYLAAGGEIGGFEKLCVIKKVLTEKADKTKANRFLDEAKVVLRLSHSALVTTFDAGEVDGEFYIAMELVEGKDLREVWNRCVRTRQRIPLDVALHVVREVARALAYVHAYGDLKLVHRDVAPPNILLAYVGDVKLTDFGLARSVLKQEHTAPGVVFGRAAYLAPEQARGEVADARTDVYTLGIVLWELLTGQQFLQLSGLDPAAALAIVRHPKIAPPSSRAPWISPALDQVVMRALTPDRDARYSSAEEMRQGLADVMSDIAPRGDSARVAEFLRGIYSETIEEERAERDHYLKDEIPKFRAALVAPERTSLVGAEAALAAISDEDSAPSAPGAAGQPITISGPVGSPPALPVASPASAPRPRVGRSWTSPRLPGLPPSIVQPRDGISHADPSAASAPPATSVPAGPSPRLSFGGTPARPVAAATNVRLTPRAGAPVVAARTSLDAERSPVVPAPVVEESPPAEARIIAGRYRVVGTLGEGSLGIVYAVKQSDGGQDLSLRVMARSRSFDGPLADRWRREVRAVSSLGHPHSVLVHDLGITEDGASYVAMDPLSGMDLATYVAREQRLDPVLALKIVTPLCQVLGAAHAAGVAHGALRPESIFLAPRGKSVDAVKLIDFGLAAALTKDLVPRRLTPESLPANVVEYLAPEQLAGQAPDVLSDVFGVGVILYEMLTGAPPHAGSGDLVGRRSQEAPQSPRMFRPDISEPLERLTLAMLDRDRTRRPRSMADVETALVGLAVPGVRPATGADPAGSDLVVGAEERSQRRVTRDAAFRAIADLSAEPPAALPALLAPRTAPEVVFGVPVDETATTDPEIPTLPASALRPSAAQTSSSSIPARIPGGGMLARYGAGSARKQTSPISGAVVQVGGGLAVVGLLLLLLLTDTFSCRDRSAASKPSAKTATTKKP